MEKLTLGIIITVAIFVIYLGVVQLKFIRCNSENLKQMYNDVQFLDREVEKLRTKVNDIQAMHAGQLPPKTVLGEPGQLPLNWEEETHKKSRKVKK